MKFEVTNHAKYRLEERGISLTKIKQVILNYEKISVNNDGSIKVVKNNLSVVYRKTKQIYIIITAYYGD